MQCSAHTASVYGECKTIFRRSVSGELHVPLDVCGAVVRRELEFWKIDDCDIEPCCWAVYSTSTDNQSTLSALNEGADREIRELNAVSQLTGWRRTQMKVWMVLDCPRSSRTAMTATRWFLFWRLRQRTKATPNPPSTIYPPQTDNASAPSADARLALHSLKRCFTDRINLEEYPKTALSSVFSLIPSPGAPKDNWSHTTGDTDHKAVRDDADDDDYAKLWTKFPKVEQSCYYDHASRRCHGGSARIYCHGGSARIHCHGGSARIYCHGGSARIHCHGGSARIYCHGRSARIHCHGGSARIQCHGGSARIHCHGGSARIHCHGGSARIHCHGGSARIHCHGGPPVYIVTEGPPVYIVTESPPVYIVTEGPPVYIATERPPVYIVTEGPPVYIATERPPVYIAAEGPPVYIVTEGPPVYIVTEGPPVYIVTECPPAYIVTEGPPVHIVTEGPPVYTPCRKLQCDKKTQMEEQLRQWEPCKVIVRCESNWASPIHVVTEPDGSWCVCRDFRRVNAMTKLDRYPLPALTTFIERLVGCAVFSEVDFRQAFQQVCVDEVSQDNRAIFMTLGFF
ncbi:hypothetical protein LSAT2_005431 [Lamellibrachia satsuma]|nr:hypothetical protein LSAT2_005431 [Lamellibrachia satsuma]